MSSSRTVSFCGACVCCTFLLSLFVARTRAAEEFPAVAPTTQPTVMGEHIQRTMTLLATSTPEHRNHVRVLFYGQSITEQEWSKQVADDLRRRFPNADLEIENRAIGGFASQLLIRPAEHDLYPLYPDLLIFHVYGANQQYEQIIHSTRSRTTAEVLMQKDHITQWPPDVVDENKDKGAWWSDMMNNHFLPDIASKNGCGLVDIRSPWLAYLKSNHLEPSALLKDGVHLNAHGNFVMSHLVEQYLVYRPELPKDEWLGLVKTIEVGKDAQWKDGKLTLKFEGNRIDAIGSVTSEGDGSRPAAKVTIDGKKPSEFPGCYYIPRPQPGPWSALALPRVDHDAPLLLEDWTLKLTSVDADSKTWKFDVAGSVTGPDGSGESDKPFTSKSGRVKIDPAAWFPHGTIAAGYEIHWKVLPLFTDLYAAPKSTDRSRESAVTLAQGLDNAEHTLELDTGTGHASTLVALRVYKPPVK